MIINLGSQTFTLDPSGTLLWPKHNLLVVSDMHLEKGSHHARRGFFLPPYDSQETLERLLKICHEHVISRILILGDCFHDPAGFHRLGTQELFLFDQLKKLNPVWIMGNHDGDYVPDGFTAHESFILDDIIFRHQASKMETGFEISGHFHPKTTLIYKGENITHECFIEDGIRLIIPAFGAYTGGLDTSNKEIQSLFPRSFRTHILGTNKIITLKNV